MSAVVKEAAELMDILPTSEQTLALEMIKRLVLAWDPDFTRLTPRERQELELAREDPETISHEMIDWS